MKNYPECKELSKSSMVYNRLSLQSVKEGIFQKYTTIQVFYHLTNLMVGDTSPMAMESMRNGDLTLRIYQWNTRSKFIIVYSKTCVKWPLKHRQNKDLNDPLLLNAGRKCCRMLLLEHSAIPLGGAENINKQ